MERVPDNYIYQTVHLHGPQRRVRDIEATFNEIISKFAVATVRAEANNQGEASGSSSTYPRETKAMKDKGKKIQGRPKPKNVTPKK